MPECSKSPSKSPTPAVNGTVTSLGLAELFVEILLKGGGGGGGGGEGGIGGGLNDTFRIV